MKYFFVIAENSKGTAGVGVLVAEKWIEKVFDERSSGAII